MAGAEGAARRRWPASPASCGPFARLAKPSEGDELSRIQTSLIRAGYRSENAVEIFLGVKLLLTPIAILLLWQINAHLDEPYEFPMSFAVALIACAIAFFVPNIWLYNKTTKRKQALEQPLPDAMDLLVTCVEAGLSPRRRDGARRRRRWSWSAPLLAAGAQADDARDPGGREALGCLSPALAPHGRRRSASRSRP